MITKIPEITLKSSSRRRILLDTNIWRYIVDNNSQGRLLKLARDGLFDVQIAPCVIYETLRLKDVHLRASLIHLMTNPIFHRLMPEAYSESMEILRTIERVKPDWLRDIPDLIFFNRLRNDWARRMGGFWVRCKQSPESEAAFLSHIESEMIEGARAESEAARKEMIEIGWKRNPPMDKTLIGFNTPMPGWRGEPVEAWRIDSFMGLTYNLPYKGNAYRDWIGPFMELDYGLLASDAWGEFWFYLINKEELPRQWMRWAHSFAQRFRKTTPGSPGDTQLFVYFLETDVVVTADKALLEILEECRPYAPCQLPEGKLISANYSGISDFFDMLSIQ